jgi:hypothetical protein
MYLKELPGGQRAARRKRNEMSRPTACLVNGNHTPGSKWEHECPLRNLDKRSERSRKNALEGWARRREREARLRATGLSRALPDASNFCTAVQITRRPGSEWETSVRPNDPSPLPTPGRQESPRSGRGPVQ